MCMHHVFTHVCVGMGSHQGHLRPTRPTLYLTPPCLAACARAEVDELREQLAVYKAEVQRLQSDGRRGGGHSVAGRTRRSGAASVASFRSRVSATRPKSAGHQRRAGTSPSRPHGVARPQSATPPRPPRHGNGAGGSGAETGGATGTVRGVPIPPYDPYSFMAAAAMTHEPLWEDGRGHDQGPEVEGASDAEGEALRAQVQRLASTQDQLSGAELAQRVSNLAASVSASVGGGPMGAHSPPAVS